MSNDLLMCLSVLVTLFIYALGSFALVMLMIWAFVPDCRDEIRKEFKGK